MDVLLVLSIGFFVGLILLALAQTPFVARMVADAARVRPPILADGDCPKVAVILCLRGSDPFLRNCIEALLDQDYPSYHIFVVVDDINDPAAEAVRDVIQHRRDADALLKIQVLIRRLTTCSLINSGWVQILDTLDDSYEILVEADADAITYPTWIRELVSPLVDGEVGATTGHRWYEPTTLSWGSLARYIWNSATTASVIHSTVWGGSCAVKRACIEQSALIERLQTSLVEDLVIYQEMVRLGKRVAFVPTAMMINRETCTLTEFFRWLQRQLLIGRLYQPVWSMILGHGVATAGVLAGAVLTALAGILWQCWPAVGWCAAGLTFYIATMVALLATMERTVRKLVAYREQPTRWISAWSLAKGILALPVTQIVYWLALAKAQFLRKIEWRQIHYKIDGQTIEMGDYRPYQQPGTAAPSAVPPPMGLRYRRSAESAENADTLSSL